MLEIADSDEAVELDDMMYDLSKFADCIASDASFPGRSQRSQLCA